MESTEIEKLKALVEEKANIRKELEMLKSIRINTSNRIKTLTARQSELDSTLIHLVTGEETVSSQIVSENTNQLTLNF